MKALREVTKEVAQEFAPFVEETVNAGNDTEIAVELVLIAFISRWYTEMHGPMNLDPITPQDALDELRDST